MSELGEFRIIGHKGFHIRLGNGMCVSVQFGGGNYGDNYHMRIGTEREHHRLASRTAEIAIWDESGDGESKWVTQEFSGNAHDPVLGYQTPEQVLAALNWAAMRQPAREGGDERSS